MKNEPENPPATGDAARIAKIRKEHDCGCEVCATTSVVCPASASTYAERIAELERMVAKQEQELMDHAEDWALCGIDPNSETAKKLVAHCHKREQERAELSQLRAQLAASEKDRDALKLGIVAAIDIATGHADPMPSLYRVEEHLRAILDAAMKEAR